VTHVVVVYRNSHSSRINDVALLSHQVNFAVLHSFAVLAQAK